MDGLMDRDYPPFRLSPVLLRFREAAIAASVENTPSKGTYRAIGKMTRGLLESHDERRQLGGGGGGRE